MSWNKGNTSPNDAHVRIYLWQKNINISDTFVSNEHVADFVDKTLSRSEKAVFIEKAINDQSVRERIAAAHHAKKVASGQNDSINGSSVVPFTFKKRPVFYGSSFAAAAAVAYFMIVPLFVNQEPLYLEQNYGLLPLNELRLQARSLDVGFDVRRTNGNREAQLFIKGRQLAQINMLNLPSDTVGFSIVEPKNDVEKAIVSLGEWSEITSQTCDLTLDVNAKFWAAQFDLQNKILTTIDDRALTGRQAIMSNKQAICLSASQMVQYFDTASPR